LKKWTPINVNENKKKENKKRTDRVISWKSEQRKQEKKRELYLEKMNTHAPWMKTNQRKKKRKERVNVFYSNQKKKIICMQNSSLWVILSTSIFPLADTFFLATTQSTETVVSADTHSGLEPSKIPSWKLLFLLLLSVFLFLRKWTPMNMNENKRKKTRKEKERIISWKSGHRRKKHKKRKESYILKRWTPMHREWKQTKERKREKRELMYSTQIKKMICLKSFSIFSLLYKWMLQNGLYKWAEAIGLNLC